MLNCRVYSHPKTLFQDNRFIAKASTTKYINKMLQIM